MLPDGLEERFRALRRRRKERQALKEERAAAVVRTVYGTEAGLWVPADPLQVRPWRPPPQLVEAPGPDDLVAGLDAAGRAVVVRAAYDHRDQPAAAAILGDDDSWGIAGALLRWTSDREVEVIGMLTTDGISHVSWCVLDEGGRVRSIRTAGVPYNTLGKGASVLEAEWDGDRCVQTSTWTADDRGRWTGPSVVTGEHDAHGLRRVHTTEGVCWDRERHAWEPDPPDDDEAVDVLAEHLARAADALVAAAQDPVLVRVRADLSPHDPPQVRVIERAEVAVLARHEPVRQAVLMSQGTVVDPLVGAPGDVLRAYRALAAAADARRVEQRVGQGLHDRPWTDRCLPLLPDAASTGDLWAATDAAFGRERVDRVLDPGVTPVAVPEVTRWPTSRAELAELAAAFEVPAFLAGEAEWGIALQPGGSGTSRLGGRAALPVGQPWPTCDGRGLTHLATIDLAELPPIEGRDALPADGTLVFFADLSEEAALYEPTPIDGDERAVVVHLPPGTPTHEPAPPAGDDDEHAVPVVLRERRVRGIPRLTFDTLGWEDPRLEGNAGHERLVGALLEAGDAGGHQVLGRPDGVQADPRESDHVAVLHVSWDEDLGFWFLDGGTLTFHGPAEDVRAGRWDRLWVTADSG